MNEDNFMEWFERKEAELRVLFIEKYLDEWDDYVEKEYISYVSGDCDAQYERMKEDEMEERFLEGKDGKI